MTCAALLFGVTVRGWSSIGLELWTGSPTTVPKEMI
jgi:hypothetical protein